MDKIRMKDISAEVWNQLLDKIKGASFAYTAESILFQITYANLVIANESYIMMRDKKPIACVCLYITENKNERTISWNGRYCPALLIDHDLSYKTQEKVCKEIMEDIQQIEENYACIKTMFKFEPIGNPEHLCKIENYNYLIKYGYNDTSSLTQVLDLRLDQETLYQEVTQNHKRGIKKGLKYEIEFLDKDSVTLEDVKEYKDIYEYDAGMVTRNSELWEQYYMFIKAGFGILGFAKKDGKRVATVIVTKYKNTAYYSSYAEKTDCLDGITVGHKLHWEMILYLKKHGIKFYEMGEQVFGNYPKGTEDAKLVNISKFKRGFGGYTVPIFRGIKNVKQVKACTQQ